MTSESANSRSLSCRSVREVDRIAIEEFGMPGLVLMENAGRGAAELTARLAATADGKILIACGPGNNGGDGFVVARHLDNRGFDVVVLLCCDRDRLKGDAAANFRWLEHTEVAVVQDTDWTPPDAAPSVAVDALLGTGSQGELRPRIATCVEVLNSFASRRLAVDIPSGICGDTGTVSDVAFRADVTATFVATKPGLYQPSARAYVGELHVIDIGVPLKATLSRLPMT